VGYNDEHSLVLPPRFLAFDLETYRREDVAHLIPEPEAAKNLRDPEKIEADLARKRQELHANLSLDPNGCRIVALGYQSESMLEPEVIVIQDVQQEPLALKPFWQMTTDRRLVGFRSRSFDLPVLFQRSRYGRVSTMPRDWRAWLAPYGRTRLHVDLHDEATFDGIRSESSIPRSLTSFCSLFGVDVPTDDGQGCDMAALVEAEDWEAVRLHCYRDVQRTVGLARALDVIPQMQELPF
jgi:hypothetical protein